MSAEELRELADWLAADDYAAQDRYRAAAYLRACADALDAGPVAWTQQDDEALEPDMQSAWISVQDRMPPDDTPVLVYVPGNEMLAFAIDQWQMQREAPLGWSSATIETGMGWGDHDYEDVSHWMPLTAPGHPHRASVLQRRRRRGRASPHAAAPAARARHEPAPRQKSVGARRGGRRGARGSGDPAVRDGTRDRAHRPAHARERILRTRQRNPKSAKSNPSTSTSSTSRHSAPTPPNGSTSTSSATGAR